MSAPVLSWLFHALRNVPKDFPSRPGNSRKKVAVARNPLLAVTLSSLGLLGPTLRANPYPEVTDLFCRLPLSTLFYRLEAVHLGDLMRLCVRPRKIGSRSPGFSRAVIGAPDTTKLWCFTNHWALSPNDSIPGPSGC